jgi:hypothetical protein
VFALCVVLGAFLLNVYVGVAGSVSPLCQINNSILLDVCEVSFTVIK